jgi:hypothetical protein
MLAPEDRVNWLQIENLQTKESVALRRDDKGWRLESPVSYPAEDLLVRGMAIALSRAHRLRRFPFKNVERLPKELGFASPYLKVGVRTEKEPGKKHLWIGNESPIGKMVYARWEGEEEYFLAPPEFRAIFDRTAYSLRRKKLFRVNWEEVTWMELKGWKKEYRLERNGAVWRAALGDRAVEIPLEKAQDLIYAFQSLYVKDFLDKKNVGNNELRLQKSRNYAAVGGKGEMREALILGAAEKNKDSLYAYREKENLVILVSESRVRALWNKFDNALGGLGRSS